MNPTPPSEQPGKGGARGAGGPLDFVPEVFGPKVDALGPEFDQPGVTPGKTMPAEEAALLVELRFALRTGQEPPAEVTSLTRSLLSWRDADAALAELVADSRGLAGAVRAVADAVLLSFQAGDVAIDLQVDGPSSPLPSGEGGRQVFGQVDPPVPGMVHLRCLSETVTAGCDDLGRFAAHIRGGGPLSLRWIPADPTATPVDTPWLLL